MPETIYIAKENTTHSSLGFRDPEQAAEWVEDHVEAKSSSRCEDDGFADSQSESDEDNDRVKSYERREYDSPRPPDGWYYHVTEGDMKVAGYVTRVQMDDTDEESVTLPRETVERLVEGADHLYLPAFPRETQREAINEAVMEATEELRDD